MADSKRIPGMISASKVADYDAFERLINGTEIQVVYENLPVNSGTELAQFAPVSIDESGSVIIASDGTPAIGIAMWPVDGEAGGATVSVLRAGVLNPDAIAWDDSYDTAAKKAAAFRGAPAPTNIIVKRNV